MLYILSVIIRLLIIFKSMKSILTLLAAAVLGILSNLSCADATANCLYCRRSSVGATLLVSYSYCAASDTCL